MKYLKEIVYQLITLLLFLYLVFTGGLWLALRWPNSDWLNFLNWQPDPATYVVIYVLPSLIYTYLVLKRWETDYATYKLGRT